MGNLSTTSFFYHLQTVCVVTDTTSFIPENLKKYERPRHKHSASSGVVNSRPDTPLILPSILHFAANSLFPNTLRASLYS